MVREIPLGRIGTPSVALLLEGLLVQERSRHIPAVMLIGHNFHSPIVNWCGSSHDWFSGF